MTEYFDTYGQWFFLNFVYKYEILVIRSSWSFFCSGRTAFMVPCPDHFDIISPFLPASLSDALVFIPGQAHIYRDPGL